MFLLPPLLLKILVYSITFYRFLRKKTGIKVKVVARGTGAAIEMGKRGDADAVFVHAKELELEAVKQGYFINRHDVCYNDFIIVGPKNDPAGIKGLKKKPRMRLKELLYLRVFSFQEVINQELM